MEKMLRLPILISLGLLICSCSQEKKIKKFVDKHTPVKVAAYIAKNHSSVFKSDTIYIRDTVTIKVPFVVERIIHDTIIKYVSTNDCKSFDYSDKNLAFHIRDNTRVWYDINERNFEKEVKVPFAKKVICPPCAQESVIDELRNQLIKAKQKTGFLIFQQYCFWIFWILIAIYLIVKFLIKK